MDGAAAFAAGYATIAEVGALGLRRLGVVVARRQPGALRGEAMTWPHLGSAELHSVVAWVATAAAVLLACVMAILHHGAADLAVLAVPIVLGAVMLGRAASDVRHALRGTDG
ncbi:MAG TPA: hypothetical protein VHE57_08775 [Mycobacteriales bacterium]|jgi:hypothetical protein|nr:hypothetical protein [Mycobacteriales bacterium]